MTKLAPVVPQDEQDNKDNDLKDQANDMMDKPGGAAFVLLGVLAIPVMAMAAIDTVAEAISHPLSSLMAISRQLGQELKEEAAFVQKKVADRVSSFSFFSRNNETSNKSADVNDKEAEQTPSYKFS